MDMTDNSNPYQSPEYHLVETAPAPAPSPANLRQWLAVFASNLLLPLVFARILVQGKGWAGVALGIAFLLATTWMLHYASPRMMKITWRGGITVAYLQAFPILHYFAGHFGHWLAEQLGTAQEMDFDRFLATLNSIAAGFVATVGTGLALLCAAFLIGVFYSLDHRQSNRGRGIE